VEGNPQGLLRADPSDGPAGADNRPNEPSAVRALVRGLAKRCPRCGERDLFVHWLKIRDLLPPVPAPPGTRGGRLPRPMTINYSVTTLAWVAFLVIWLIVDLPGVRVVPLTFASVLLVGIFPLAFYPFSKTIWAAVDYLVFRSSPDYASEDSADRAPGNGGRY